jgi:hypothetical protein
MRFIVRLRCLRRSGMVGLMVDVERRKHLRLDQSKIDMARKILGAKTEQETLDQALDLVIATVPILRIHRAIRVGEARAWRVTLRDRDVLRATEPQELVQPLDDLARALEARALVGARVEPSRDGRRYHLALWPRHRPAFQSLMLTVQVASGRGVVLTEPPFWFTTWSSRRGWRAGGCSSTCWWSTCATPSGW